MLSKLLFTELCTNTPNYDDDISFEFNIIISTYFFKKLDLCDKNNLQIN